MATNENKKQDEAGAFWKRQSKSGTTFLSGKIKTKSGEEVSLVVFQNTYKTEGSKEPDYRVYFDKPFVKSGEAAPASAAAQPPVIDDDIPF